MNNFSHFVDDLLNRNQKLYHLAATLEGHNGPINTFSVNESGTLLASGGDDEEVRIWDTKKFRRCQTIIDPANQWGQITVVKFLRFDSVNMGPEWLCFGTGRGQFLIYRRSRKATEFIGCVGMRIFSSGDAVEAFTFDQHHQRFALSSHYGKVKVFHFDKGNLIELWGDELLDAIPRAILFTEKGKDVSIFGMENGMIYYRDAETSHEKCTKVLKTPIGNVTPCPVTANFLVDNMRDGFDLYAPNRTMPIRSFRIHSAKKYVKGGVFGEGGKIVVCGSDHGKIYVFGVSDEEPSQELVHGSRQQLIQTIQAATGNGHHFIFSGASDGRYDILIWKKAIHSRRGREDEKGDAVGVLLFANFLFIIILAWMTRERWFLPVRDNFHFGLTSTQVSGAVITEHLVPEKQMVQVLRPIDHILSNMDEAALRELLISAGIEQLDHQAADVERASLSQKLNKEVDKVCFV